MERLGDPIMRPFLQDVLQFVPLLRTLTLAAGQDLLTPFKVYYFSSGDCSCKHLVKNQSTLYHIHLKVIPQVGLTAMGDFFFHFVALGWYTLLASTLATPLQTVAPLLPRRIAYMARRVAEEWKFGSGLDYYDHV